MTEIKMICTVELCGKLLQFVHVCTLSYACDYESLQTVSYAGD